MQSATVPELPTKAAVVQTMRRAIAMHLTESVCPSRACPEGRGLIALRCIRALKVSGQHAEVAREMSS